MAALSGLTHSRPGRNRAPAPPAALLPSVPAAGLPLLVPSLSCSPVHAAGPRGTEGDEPELIPRPCSLPQQAEQDGPDPCRDLRNLAGCAINRQRRGGSARGRGMLPAGGAARAEPRELPLPSPGAAGNRQRLSWGGGLRCGCAPGVPPPHGSSSAERSCAGIALLPCLHGQGPSFLCSCSPLGGGCGLRASAPGRIPTNREAPPRTSPLPAQSPTPAGSTRERRFVPIYLKRR